MPEGDTIFRAARTLHGVLAQKPLVRFEAPGLEGPPPGPGEVVESVRAKGKHLLIRFSGGRTLHSHMGMNGSWHVYRPGQRWQKPRHRARVVVEAGGWVAVCFSPMTLELIGDAEAAVHERLSSLGPDLCLPDADLQEALRRMRARPNMQLGVALLDQRIACGVGNVFKSEALHAAREDPFALVRDVSDARLRTLIEIAAVQLRSNLGSGRRTTVEEGLAVYKRSGRDCRRCSATIRMLHQGKPPRSTYWCPGCQPGR
ncbi:MAG TPA: DNA-formamidopyrimidine glycosylase family protein [Actinomycetota bacterium]|nr:DNA-formamidopyrimidine glycosylase family protein [Actinomycetota bacterium]